MSEQIINEIENVKEKRKEFLVKIGEFICKYEYLGDNKNISEDFIRYVIKKSNIIDKKINKRNYILLHSYCIDKFTIEYGYGCKKSKYVPDYTNIYDLYAPKWKTMKDLLKLTLKYGEEYNILMLKKELEKLTKCQANKETNNKNPCTKICESCGCENPIDGKFCSQCGIKFK